MDHRDHVALLRPAIEAGGRWADIGAGEGAFTLALADLLGPNGRIVAVDRDHAALDRAAVAVTARFPDTTLTTVVADFTHPLAIAEGPEDMDLGGRLDGLVAANSLHFVPHDRQVDVVRALASLLRPGGRFAIVEYDADRGNPWVPNPFSSESWVAARGGGRSGRHAGDRACAEPVPPRDLFGGERPALVPGRSHARAGDGASAATAPKPPHDPLRTRRDDRPQVGANAGPSRTHDARAHGPGGAHGLTDRHRSQPQPPIEGDQRGMA